MARVPVNRELTRASDWWATVKADAAFHTIPLWGDETDGVTIKYKIDYGADTIEG